MNRGSILDLFSPPEKRTGVFCLVCGLSADERFLDSALTRFSGFDENNRKIYGNLYAVLFLDPHTDPLTRIPGLYSPWPKSSDSWKGTRLMHAKVALLGFGGSRNTKPDYYRLIVSTGNWTTEAVNQSINLVWYCDLDLNHKRGKAQEITDINEVVLFWRRLVGGMMPGEVLYKIARPASEKISNFLDGVTKDIGSSSSGYSPRFISNIFKGKTKEIGNIFRPNSIATQVFKKFRKQRMRRNILICGSGFFEQNDKGTRAKVRPQKMNQPEVLNGIVQHLKSIGLTKQAVQCLVINPETSGAIGQWIKNTPKKDLDWRIFCPRHPDLKTRVPHTFHAKYIYIGNFNKELGTLTSGVIYIGSGNLSKQGISLSPGGNGNIEAGVVFNTGNFENTHEFCEKLGFDDNKELSRDNIPDQLRGEDDEQAESEFKMAPPMDHCIWYRNTELLKWECLNVKWENADLNGISIHLPEQKEVRIDKNIDLSNGVNLSASFNGVRYQWMIPVFTIDNKLVIPPAVIKTGQEVIDSLSDFPYNYNETDVDNSEDSGVDTERRLNPFEATGDDLDIFREELDRYPLHFATTLIETIAEQNQLIQSSQMPDWIDLLKRTLIDEIQKEIKELLGSLGHDMYRILISEPGFAPLSAPKSYRDGMNEIINDWVKSYSDRGLK